MHGMMKRLIYSLKLMKALRKDEPVDKKSNILGTFRFEVVQEMLGDFICGLSQTKETERRETNERSQLEAGEQNAYGQGEQGQVDSGKGDSVLMTIVKSYFAKPSHQYLDANSHYTE